MSSLSDSDRVQRFQAALDDIAHEAEARNELAGRHVTEAFTASQAELGRQAEALDDAVREQSERREQANSARGGEPFGFEDDQDVHEAPVWPTQPPPRHRLSTGPEFDDEDFSNTNWLSS